MFLLYILKLSIYLVSHHPSSGRAGVIWKETEGENSSVCTALTTDQSRQGETQLAFH